MFSIQYVDILFIPMFTVNTLTHNYSWLAWCRDPLERTNLPSTAGFKSMTVWSWEGRSYPDSQSMLLF